MYFVTTHVLPNLFLGLVWVWVSVCLCVPVCLCVCVCVSVYVCIWGGKRYLQEHYPSQLRTANGTFDEFLNAYVVLVFLSSFMFLLSSFLLLLLPSFMFLLSSFMRLRFSSLFFVFFPSNFFVSLRVLLCMHVYVCVYICECGRTRANFNTALTTPILLCFYLLCIHDVASLL